MANNSHVNKYARALFNISVKDNSLANIRDGLVSVMKIAKSVPEFNHLLFTKNTSSEDKSSIISNVLNGRINALVVELLVILIQNDQVQLLSNIKNKFNQLMIAKSSELDILITSNLELSSDELDFLRAGLSLKSGKQVNIKNNIDKTLIRGVQLRIGNTIIDNSLSNKLMKLKSNLKNNHANME